MNTVKALEAFLDVRVVLAHLNSEMFRNSTIYLARKFENVYLEPSWVGTSEVGRMLSELGRSSLRPHLLAAEENGGDDDDAGENVPPARSHVFHIQQIDDEV